MAFVSAQRVRQAMEDAAKAAPNAAAVDPSIANQRVQTVNNDATFGIPHFALIVFLVVTLIVFLILPSARQRRLAREQAKPIEHVYRKPNLDEYPAYVAPARRIEPVEVVDSETGEVVETEKPLFREI